MHNRLRHYRKLRGLTLAEVAERIGTTAQTVSRLETEVMTVSTDWLQRFAALYNVHAADLLDGPGRGGAEVIGVVGAGGVVQAGGDEMFAFEMPAQNPIALRVERPCGPYQPGDMLIAARFEGTDMANVIGRDAVVAVRAGPLLLRRVIAAEGGRYTLVPLDTGGDVRYAQELDWAARLILRVQRLD